MDEQMIQQLAQVYMQVVALLGLQLAPEQALEQVLQLAQAAQSGDEKATLMLLQLIKVAQQMGLQQAQAARYGAKLRYTRSLLNTCPEGYEMGYFKRGGTMCKKCMKKAEQGLKIAKYNKPKNAVEEFKCGHKK